MKMQHSTKTIWHYLLLPLLAVALVRELPAEPSKPSDLLKQKTLWALSTDNLAKGTITIGDFEDGYSGRLDFNFSNGGSYVCTKYEFKEPVKLEQVQFEVKCESPHFILVRLRDSKGKTQQYQIPYRSSGTWTPIQITEATKPSLSYGGQSSENWTGEIQSISIGLLAHPEHAAAGQLFFREVLLNR